MTTFEPLVFQDSVDQAIRAVFESGKDTAVAVPIYTDFNEGKQRTMKFVIRSRQSTNNAQKHFFNLQIALTTGIGEDTDPDLIFENGATLMFLVLQNVSGQNESWLANSLLRLVHTVYNDKIVEGEYHLSDPWWDFARLSLEKMITNPAILKESRPGRELANPGAAVEAVVEIRGGALIKE